MILWPLIVNISLNNHPKKLVLKSVILTNFTSFLDLKIDFIFNNWRISVYDKRLDKKIFIALAIRF